MKANAFCIFEYDENKETLVTFVYPSIDKETKSVIQETAHHLITNSNTLSLFNSFKNKWLYFEGKRNSDKTDIVKLYGVCVIAEELHPQLYSDFAAALAKVACDTASPPDVLRVFLQVLSQGEIESNGVDFSIDRYPDNYYTKVSYNTLLDRAGQFIPIIWQALVTGRSVCLYSPDITTLQSTCIPVLCLVRPGNRNLLPLVLDNSIAQTSAAEDTQLAIWCSSEASALGNRFDLVVDLSARTVKCSAAFQKEAGRCSLLDALMEAINTTTAAEGNVAAEVAAFNEQIIETLQAIKSRVGDLSAASIASVNLAADKKQLLSGIATSGVFQLGE